ncbi:5'-nucleotidase C-terminal domain-containing protein [Sulfitobacter sp. D35]|uniref:5'-nucleotidase C-terminal domain-containing protein n=1 Tax=Sulfitobacter sp. D35 TaxID=3083252 RepID=UPI00296FFEDD|nr:5'-nucleotidase C-terminal domain-containing protein [Sulfitobacter sp. D35]
MATTDLHMQLVGHDYVNDRPVERRGLAMLAPMIERARAEAVARGDLCLLLDNGDTLQGTPLGDWLAEQGTDVSPHPMAASLNHLRYDAVGLGNHDVDHGLPYLASVLDQYNMPVVCANLTSPTLPMLRRLAVLDRTVRDTAGEAHPLRIAVLSVLPPQTADWSRHHLEGRATVTGALDALRCALAEARAEGADLVVVLAHMGISGSESGPDPESAARAIAALDGVDAVVAGHTHLRFPGPDHDGIAGVDSRQGTLEGKAAVLPGVAGSDLGVIDLDLMRDGTRWRVQNHTARLEALPLEAPRDPAILRLSQRAHEATRSFLSAKVTELPEAMHSYFALAQAGPLSHLLAAAKRRVVSRALCGTPLEDLPLLVATAIPAVGGLEGPDNFVCLPKGAVPRRSIAGISPYHNQVWAVRVTGAQVRDWLERSARIFETLTPGNADQLLVDTRVPGFRFDTVHGLDYEIDPTRAPAFDHSGYPVPGAPRRIRNLTFRGAPLDPAQDFVMATTHYRIGGGGGYEIHHDTQVALRSNTSTERALLDCLRSDDWALPDTRPPWLFTPGLGVKAVLYTAPDAVRHLSDLAWMAPEPLAPTCDGFLPVRLSL